jgi:hypothetical protein
MVLRNLGKTHRVRVRHGGQAIARLPPEHLAEPLANIKTTPCDNSY